MHPDTPPLLSRVILRNYKSIAHCDVSLGSLSFLVGPNGAGKTNFLDAIQFVSDALRHSLDQALRRRSGINEVRRKSGGHPRHFSIQLDFQLHNGTHGQYGFKVGARTDGGFGIQHEVLRVYQADGLTEDSFDVRNGVVSSSLQKPPAAASDRLYLVHVSGFEVFRPAFDALSRMEKYNMNPEMIRIPQTADAGELLRPDGGNAASVLSKLAPPTRQRVGFYLSKIVEGVGDPEMLLFGAHETIEFRQKVRGQKHPWKFLASSMSDGTLRAFGILLALFQTGIKGGPPLVGLEEPETALHPAATALLLSALKEASLDRQVVVTSHSPELLDSADIAPESLWAVASVDGMTEIGPVDEASREAIRKRLFTPGELLRQNQITVDRDAVPASPRQEIFDFVRE